MWLDFAASYQDKGDISDYCCPQRQKHQFELLSTPALPRPQIF